MSPTIARLNGFQMNYKSKSKKQTHPIERKRFPFGMRRRRTVGNPTPLLSSLDLVCGRSVIGCVCWGCGGLMVFGSRLGWCYFDRLWGFICDIIRDNVLYVVLGMFYICFVSI